MLYTLKAKKLQEEFFGRKCFSSKTSENPKIRGFDVF
jgi:hypothetical protein